MSFGRPSGSSRMPDVTIEVPPPPPMPIMPAMSSAGRHEAREGRGHGGDRPPAVARAERFLRACRPCLATSAAATSGLIVGVVGADIDDDRRQPPAAAIAGEIGEFLALRVGRADDVDALHNFLPA